MNDSLYVIIMAGGIGSKFWPFSRNKHPKQFHDILGVGKTLLQLTVDRFKNVCPEENIFVVTNKDYKNLVTEQLPFLHEDQILLEPVSRNTAPCIAYATSKIYKNNPNSICIVAPADHKISNQEEFEKTIKSAVDFAKDKDILITLGVEPNRTDTSYGYIQYYVDDTNHVKKVKTFTEKPDFDLATTFIESGEFVWNTGIFVWRSDAILNNFVKDLPEIAEIFEESTPMYFTPQEHEYMKKTYSQCKSISIDYGILEKADNVYVMLCDFGWSDLSSWKTLHEQSYKNEQSNVISGNIMTYETTNCLIKAPGEKLVVVHGLDGYIVAEHDGVLMICKKENEELVKSFLVDIKTKNAYYL
jgi:mannose-1-phosphate guanylyltransferase